VKAVIHHTNGVEEHADCIDGNLTLRCVAQNDGVSHVYEKRLSLSEISSLEIGGHPQPAPPQTPPKTEILTQSRAAYFLGAENEKYGSKEDREKMIETTIAKRSKR
jgi:hypothetical protein